MVSYRWRGFPRLLVSKHDWPLHCVVFKKRNSMLRLLASRRSDSLYCAGEVQRTWTKKVLKVRIQSKSRVRRRLSSRERQISIFSTETVNVYVAASSSMLTRVSVIKAGQQSVTNNNNNSDYGIIRHITIKEIIKTRHSDTSDVS